MIGPRDRIRCPECQSRQQRSTVRITGVVSPEGREDAFWDEDGSYHSHGVGPTETQLTCSLGHTFSVESTNDCWCQADSSSASPHSA
jgi:hypothetical protein